MRFRLCDGCHEHIEATGGCLREACGMPCNQLGVVVATVKGETAPAGAARSRAGQHFFPPPRLRPTITSLLSEPPASQEGGLPRPSPDEAREDSTPATDPAEQLSHGAFEVPGVYFAAEGGGAEGGQSGVVCEVGDRHETSVTKAWAQCQRTARKALRVLRQALVRHLL